MESSRRVRWFAGIPAVVFVLAGSKLLLHLVFAHRYNFFRDELYFIACSRHLAWGYVDQPPLIALLVWLEMHLGGSSLTSLRFLPALAGAALVVLTALLAREMGAGRFGIFFAALACSLTGIYFVMHYLMTMNAFEPLFWMGCAYLLLRILRTGNQRLWLWFGALAGLGLQNKYSMGVFAAGLVAGLLLSPERKALARPWIWLGGALAFLVFLPNLLWNMHHGWPFIELMANIKASGRDVALGPVEYFLQQIVVINPVLFPLWLVGLLWLFFSARGRGYRVLGWAYAVSLAVFIVTKGKNYYLAPAYPMLFAAGAVPLEGFLDRVKKPWLKPALVVVILVPSLLFLPLGLPVLPADQFVRYLNALPFSMPVSEHSHAGAAMPQYYSDQFGWEEMTAAVARTYNRLTPEERAQACIGAVNYGEAGAIDFFGPRYGLPPAISGHQNYFLWGPRDCTGKVLILLGHRLEILRDHCASVEVAAELYHPYAVKFENRPVLVCRGLKTDLRTLWPGMKIWD